MALLVGDAMNNVEREVRVCLPHVHLMFSNHLHLFQINFVVGAAIQILYFNVNLLAYLRYTHELIV